MEDSKLYTVASRFGRSDNADDVEAILDADGFARWPTHAIALRHVIYWRTREDAEVAAKQLGAHRDGASVSVVPHYADADYITRDDPPIRSWVGHVRSGKVR